jgi:hypothetical protein
MTRKYFYLVTEHEESERVGGVSVMDSPMSRPTKNNEAPIRTLNDEKEDFIVVGKKVGLGYHDFESEGEYEERAADVMQSKIRDVDYEWAEKAGIADLVYEEVSGE